MREFEVGIDKLVVGGDGLGREQGGRVVFVPGTAPGERHRVRVVREKKDFVRAVSVQLLESSPDRRSPPCPYYETCGGCALMHLRPEAQLQAKKRILLEGIERLTRAPYQGPLRVHQAAELDYRNRVRFHVVLSQGRLIAGFRRRESSEVVDIDRCIVATSTLNECWQRVRRALAARPRFARNLQSIELEESTREPGRIAARFVVSSIDGLRSFDADGREELLSEIGLEGMVVAVSPDSGGGPWSHAGKPSVEHEVSGFTLQQSVGSFFQSNRFLLQKLVDAVLPEGSPEAARGLDLFCGVGLFTIPLSRKVSGAVGVESSTLALQDARANAERAAAEKGEAKLRFARGDAASYAARAKLLRDDVVILDPPRGGLEPDLVESLGRSPVRSLRYVSCDPPALFRDLSRLFGYGFTVESLELFDLFPNTQHMEVVALLSRPA